MQQSAHRTNELCNQTTANAMLTALDALTKGFDVIQKLLTLKEAAKNKEPLRRYILVLYQSLSDLEKALETYPQCHVIRYGPDDGVSEAVVKWDEPTKEPNRSALQKAAQRCIQQLEQIGITIEVFDPELHTELREVSLLMKRLGSQKGLPSDEEIILAHYLSESITKTRQNLRQFIAEHYLPKDFV